MGSFDFILDDFWKSGITPVVADPASVSASSRRQCDSDLPYVHLIGGLVQMPLERLRFFFGFALQNLRKRTSVVSLESYCMFSGFYLPSSQNEPENISPGSAKAHLGHAGRLNYTLGELMNETEKLESILFKNYSHKNRILIPFKADEPFHYNACVGNNGLVSNQTYYDGYEKTIDIFMVNLIRHNGEDVDCAIYPILYSTRHILELMLKEISFKHKNIRFPGALHQYENTHSIKLLFDDIFQNLWDFDRRFRNSLLKIKPVIVSIGDIDDTGQTFRYAFDSEGVKHLTNIRIINVLEFYKSSKMVIFHLRMMVRLLNLIEDERRRGLFTNTLSYRDIEIVAENLPKKSKWGTAEFTDVCNYYKNKYSIGSRQLSMAICLIKKCHLFNIVDDSIQKRIRNVYLTNILNTLSRYSKCSRTSDKSPRFVDVKETFHNMKHYYRRKSIYAKYIVLNYSKSEITDAVVLYTLGKPDFNANDFELIRANLSEFIEDYDDNKPENVLLRSAFPSDYIKAGMKKIRIA